MKVSELVDSAVYKLRKHVEQIDDVSDEDEEIGDDFENLYKGEISKSGLPILPSKRARKIPEKIQVSKEDLAELQNTEEQVVTTPTSEETSEEQNEDVSIEDLKEAEESTPEEDTESTNS